MKLANLKHPVMASWLRELGCRLDARPFVSGALEARKTLQALSARKDELHTLTRGGLAGIFHAGREGRTWVDDPEYGVPFLGSSDILDADLSNLPLMSKKQVAGNPQFVIHQGWTLITRSGTIGRTAYVRAEMNGMACSEHAMRVVPDESKILPGYLYAFISSKYGVPIVVSGTYGSIIQSIEPQHIATLPVPRLGKRLEQKVHDLVQDAAAKRTEASRLMADAVGILFKTTDMTTPRYWHSYRTPFCNQAASQQLRERMDAFYFCEPNEESRKAFDSTGELTPLCKVAEVFIPGIFKRRYADEREFGVPYLTGADIFTIAPTSDKYLMTSVAQQYHLVLRHGMIVIQEAGQLSGLIGRSVLVGEYLDGFACSNNMVRVVPHDYADAGYIFAVLSNEHGVRLIKREGAGSSIPHLERDRVANIEIPWPKKTTRDKIGIPVIEAIQLRDQANRSEAEARDLVENAITGDF